jgi:hypothetical protein
MAGSYTRRNFPAFPPSSGCRRYARPRAWRRVGDDITLSYHCATVVSMAVRKKRSISMPPDLDAEIAAAAARAGMSYSAWLADTARKEFTIRAGLAAVSQFEHDHGAFTPEELAEAQQWAATALERARQSGSSARRRTA